MKSTHPGRLQRWLGAECVNELSRSMRGWYGPPIPVDGVPGNVFACGDGDFIGEIRAGYEATASDRAREIVRRMRRAYRRTCRPSSVLQTGGFSTLADFISEATNAGKLQRLYFNKSVAAAGTGQFCSLFTSNPVPPAGVAAAAAPGGTVPTNATQGSLPFRNSISGDKAFVAGSVQLSNTLASLLLYDRIFAVKKTVNSTATEAVTGVPARYQSTTPGDPDYAAGNFLFPEVSVAHGGGAHNWTVCTYTDQDGNAGATLPSAAGVVAASAPTLDLIQWQWFMPLASGDNGVKALTQMQVDASLSSGSIDFVIGHPLAWLPNPVASFSTISDGVKSSFNLSRVFDDACLAFLHVHSAGVWQGYVDVVSG